MHCEASPKSSAMYPVCKMSIRAIVIFLNWYQCMLFYEPGVVVIRVVVGSTDVVGSTVGVVVGCVVVCSVVVATVVVVSSVVVVAAVLRSTHFAISGEKISLMLKKNFYLLVKLTSLLKSSSMLLRYLYYALRLYRLLITTG